MCVCVCVCVCVRACVRACVCARARTHAHKIRMSVSDSRREKYETACMGVVNVLYGCSERPVRV